MRGEVDLVDQHHLCCAEHVRIFEWLVLALRGGDNGDLHPLTQIEHRRTNKIADILDQQQRAGFRCEFFNSAGNHIGFEVTAGSSVDLDCTGPRFANARGIIGRLLITLDNGNRQTSFQRPDRGFEQGRLASPWRTDEIERDNTAPFEPAPVASRLAIIPVKHGGFQRYTRRLFAVVMMVMPVIMMVVMMVMPVIMMVVMMVPV